MNVVGGSFFTDPIPKADAYLIMNVIHDWADAEATQILSAVRSGMPRHGRVLLIKTIVPATPEPHYSKELDIRHAGHTGRKGTDASGVCRAGRQVRPAARSCRKHRNLILLSCLLNESTLAIVFQRSGVHRNHFADRNSLRIVIPWLQLNLK